MNQQWKGSLLILFCFAVLLGGLGYSCYEIFFQTPNSRMALIPGRESRNIASIESNLIESIDLDCQGRPAKQIVRANKIRFIIHCAESGQMTLVNEQNHFTAAIFADGQNSITDLVSLVEGENKFTFVLPGGRSKKFHLSKVD